MNDETPAFYDIFVRDFLNENQPLATIQVRPNLKLGDLHQKLFDTLPSKIKSVTRLQVWHNNKKVSDQDATLE